MAVEQVYAIVSELAGELGDPLGPAQPLGGGTAGRNYRVRMTTGEYVVRLPRTDSSPLGTSREAERMANEMAASLGIAPDVVAAGPDWLVTRFLDRHPIDPQRLRADPEPLGMALRSFHRSGLQLPVRSWVPEQLDRIAATVPDPGGSDPGGSDPGAWAGAQAVTARIAEVLPLTDPVPSHNNLRSDNVLELVPASQTGPARIAFVDWEYAGMGHHLFDLASLALHNDLDEPAQERLLAAYLGEQPGEARRAALALMGLMAHAREAAWALEQGAASVPTPALQARASEHFRQLLEGAAESRFEAWLRSAAA